MRAGALLAAALILAFLGLCWQIDRTGRVDQARPADAIVVLGAQTLADGSPGPDLIERTEHGVALYRAGFAGHILFTGGSGPLSAAQQGRNLAISLGVPPERALAVEGAWETLSDASTSAPVLQAHGWQTILLVTHPLHCFRARCFFSRHGLRVWVSPTALVTQVPQPWRTYYAAREAIGVIWPYLPIPTPLTLWLQNTVYSYQ